MTLLGCGYKVSANEWKNKIYFDFSRMQPNFMPRRDIKLVQIEDKTKKSIFVEMQPNFMPRRDIKLQKFLVNL
jgi:hypothetical protein